MCSSDLVPRRTTTGRPTGVLALRRRRQNVVLALMLLLANLLVVAFTDTWSPRVLALVVSLLAAPMLHTVLFRRT